MKKDYISSPPTPYRERCSNIELLRIVSMCMILFLHAFHGPDHISKETFSAFIAIDYFNESLCMASVDIYVLISGYFSIQWKKKSFLRLISQVYFFVVLIYVAFVVSGNHVFSMKDLVKATNALHQYWFITSYIGLYFLSPILNMFCKHTSKKGMQLILCVLFIWQTYYNLFHIDGSFGLGNSVVLFCNLYLLGRYAREYELFDKIKCNKDSLLIAILFTAATISFIVIVFMMVSGVDRNFIVGPIWLFSNYNPLVIIEAVLFFCLLKKIKLNNRFVNIVGGSSLSVYLLHLHPLTREYYFQFTTSLYNHPALLHYLLLIVLFVAVFIVAVSLDQIHKWLYNKTYICFYSHKKTKE